MTTERRRRDMFLPPHPTEVGRFAFQAAVLQGRQGDVIEVYFPPAVEHADQIVNQSKPLEMTTITTTNDEV